MKTRTVVLSGLLCFFVGCAQTPQRDIFPPGGTRDDVAAKWGPPKQVKRIGSRERWVYTTAMEGRETWFVEFDTNGRASNPVQVLTNERILGLRVGMNVDEVEDLIGPKYYELRYPFKKEEAVHIYRFLRSEREAVCLYVHYSPELRVNEIGYRPDVLRVITLQQACQH